ncbi:helix-turn-helix transcriptional regulator [Paenibacillus sp. PCH8]|uniref:helix-turn-helix transcriptional regulator n=1 Tax=Paenibacillus sp. PCH8 TaxID=2066524 RepID=UPI0015E2E17C|nr:helix-turn-helix transcriptional regulator [Paenibacillus sp. PCH8]
MKQVEQRVRPSMGLLNLNKGDQRYQLTRHLPCEALRPFVKHYWRVTWDLTGLEVYLQHVVPNPCVNLVVERNNTYFFGPSGRKFSYLVSGKGSAFGVKFKPGGFYPFLRVPVSSLYGQPMDVSSILDTTAGALEERLLGQGYDADKISYIDQLLHAHLPTEDTQARLVSDIVQQIEQNREMLRVDDLSSYWNIHKRKLQRLFNQYVGIGPKTVIKLYRLQNAAELMDHGLHCDLVKLSQDLGYHDQSHFIRDFKSIIGNTPEEYLNSKQETGNSEGL